MKHRVLYEMEIKIPRNYDDPTSRSRTEWVLVEATSPRGALLLAKELGEPGQILSVFRSKITKIRLQREDD